jgi:UDP-N-acetyl-D-galactosamine dehydrogenase
MLKKKIQVDGARVLLMGLAFKENCPDIRNTKIVDILAELQEYNVAVDVYDPWVSAAEAKHEYNIDLIGELNTDHYDAIVLAVAHKQFKEMTATEIRSLGRSSHIVYDLKYILDKTESDIRL